MFFSINANRANTGQSILQTFFLCLKRTLLRAVLKFFWRDICFYKFFLISENKYTEHFPDSDTGTSKKTTETPRTLTLTLTLTLFWGDAFQFSLLFVYICRINWNFLMKFCKFDPSFNRSVLISLYLKFKLSAHAQFVITHYYVLFTNFLTWYEIETYIRDTVW